MAQFIPKTTNSKKALYFLSIMSFSKSKLKFHKLCTSKNLYSPILSRKNYFLQEMMRERAGASLAPNPSVYEPKIYDKLCFLLKLINSRMAITICVWRSQVIQLTNGHNRTSVSRKKKKSWIRDYFFLLWRPQQYLTFKICFCNSLFKGRKNMTGIVDDFELQSPTFAEVT